MRVLRLLSYQLQEMLTALIHNRGSLTQVHSSGQNSTAVAAVYPQQWTKYHSSGSSISTASECSIISTAVDKIPQQYIHSK